LITDCLPQIIIYVAKTSISLRFSIK